MGEDGNKHLSGGAGHDMLDAAPAMMLTMAKTVPTLIVAHGTGEDVMLGGFDAGPGAFDYIASTDVLRTSLLWLTPHCDGHTGVLVSWSDGSLFFEGTSTTEVASSMRSKVALWCVILRSASKEANSLFMNGQFDWMM